MPGHIGNSPAFELLIGPAGAGKSRRVREAFVRALRSRGPEPLLIVPTASYRDHTRNEILRESDIDGFPAGAVCTFVDLRPEVMSPPLTTPRRELLVRRLLQELRIPYLDGVRQYPGFRQVLVESVEEVRRAGLTPDAIEAALGPVARSERHRDFLAFSRAYDDALRRAGVDDGAALQSAIGRIEAGTSPVGLVLVDGFADFTVEQKQLLTALLTRSTGAIVTLTLDRAHRDLFYQAERSRAWLTAIPGVKFVETLLDDNHRSASETLRAVEYSLRSGRPDDVPALWHSEASVQLIAAADRRDEAELIAREIVRLVRDGYAYRDIGIIARRPADYAPLFRGVFRRIGIPLRDLDPVAFNDTAAGRHIRTCLEMFIPGSRPESVINWLKSPYSTVRDLLAIEEFEFAAMAALPDARESRWDAVLRGQSVAAAALETLGELDAALAEAHTPRTLADWAQCAFSHLSRYDELNDRMSPERVRELRADAAAIGCAQRILAEFAEAAEAERITAMEFAEFHQLFASLLGAEQLPVRDRRQDAVTLLNPFEARQWELRATFVVGLVEKEFPAPPRETLFLDDADRARIADTCAIALPDTSARAADERLLFYSAATRSRERLYFSYPQSDAKGTPLLRSLFLRGLDTLLKPWPKRRRSDVTYPLKLATGADLLGMAHVALAAPAPDPKTAGRALTIYEELRNGGVTQRAAAALDSGMARLAAPEVLDRLREIAVRFSASSFQTFASCEYKYFASNLLRLRGPAVPDEIDFLTEGSIAHETIEDWERGGRREPIGEALDRVFARQADGIPSGHRRARSQAEMRNVLERFASLEEGRAAIYRTSIESGFTELRFGTPTRPVGADNDAAVPAVELNVDGVTVSVHGRIDRLETVDVRGKRLGLIVDYKYSPGGFSAKRLDAMAQGSGLQLIIYILAAEERFGLVAAGAELYPLRADPPQRSGFYNEALAEHIFAGPPPKTAAVLPPDEFRRRIEESRRWLERHVANIRSGNIAVLPEEPKYCRNCDYYDLCRVRTWEVQREREHKLKQAAN